MANELDELNGPIAEEGRDVNVIQKQIPVKTGAGSVVFEVVLWVLGIIPGLVFLFMKIKARTYLRQLQQKIQHNASQIDNYLEQRVVILQNAAKLLDKAIDLDKDVLNPRTKKAIKSPKKSCLHYFTTMELFLLANAAVERK